MDLSSLKDVGDWLSNHGSELFIALISALFGSILSAALDFKKRSTDLFLKIKNTIKNSPGANQFNQRADHIVNNFNGVGVSTPNEALNSPPVSLGNARGVLTPNQLHIQSKIQQLFPDIYSNFEPRYQNAICHLSQNNPQVCSSEYHAAFSNIVPAILARETYKGLSVPSEENLTNAKVPFLKLKKFMESSSTDGVKLQSIITNFESAVLILLGFL